MAAYSGQVECLDLLLNAHGAKRDILDNLNYTALQIATFKNHQSSIKIIEGKPLTEIEELASGSTGTVKRTQSGSSSGSSGSSSSGAYRRRPVPTKNTRKSSVNPSTRKFSKRGSVQKASFNSQQNLEFDAHRNLTLEWQRSGSMSATNDLDDEPSPAPFLINTPQVTSPIILDTTTPVTIPVITTTPPIVVTGSTVVKTQNTIIPAITRTVVTGNGSVVTNDINMNSGVAEKGRRKSKQEKMDVTAVTGKNVTPATPSGFSTVTVVSSVVAVLGLVTMYWVNRVRAKNE